MANLTCNNCGAPLTITNQFVRTVNCKYCNSSYIFDGAAGLDPMGQGVSLADYPSRLSVGQKGVLRGRSFRVLGRVRYSYEDGFWEEWQIEWDDGAPPDWLEEDEGYWTLYRRERLKGAVPPYDQMRVGATVKVNAHNLFVTEKRQGRVVGSEGQFSSVLPLQGTFGYVQGGADNQSVSLNYWQDEIELSVGTDLEHHEIKFDK
jgi:hypothetical protein